MCIIKFKYQHIKFSSTIYIRFQTNISTLATRSRCILFLNHLPATTHTRVYSPCDDCDGNEDKPIVIFLSTHTKLFTTKKKMCIARCQFRVSLSLATTSSSHQHQLEFSDRVWCGAQMHHPLRSGSVVHLPLPLLKTHWVTCIAMHVARNFSTESI